MTVFNRDWAIAVTNAQRFGLTHFAMLHADLNPEPYWLDILLEEIEKYQADLVSVAIAIKDGKGLTSTATGRLDDIWDYTRITTTELRTLPETFGIADIPCSITRTHYGKVLLVNNGCWICDLRRPWWHDKNPDGTWKFCFTLRDRIYDGLDGRPVIEFAPEDWDFSRICGRAGAKVMATRKVKVSHWGDYQYGNQDSWGMETDSEMDNYHRTIRLETREASTNQEQESLLRSDDDESSRFAGPRAEPAAV
jgi:hypothetical protein